ncbi:MAG: 4-(cytidine 5'-diphospho)-2-C-methyl-D-erythritol kinase [Tepidisphaerales bacterium]
MLRVAAPAKLNLDLRVGPPREDGYHPLVSWFVAISLADTLTFEASATPDVRLTCSDPALSCGDDNLVVKAAKAALGERAKDLGVQVHLEKRIPMGGGLGGGSSDAAATLRGVRNLLGLPLGRHELLRLAERLGSDVPFFVSGVDSAVCAGRGEAVYPVPLPPGRWWAVLVCPGAGVSTAEVYRRFDLMGSGHHLPPVEKAIERARAWSRRPAAAVMDELVNDLEPAAVQLAPWLDAVRQVAEQAVGAAFRMTGSGSTFFRLFDDERSARDAAGRLTRAFGIPASPRVGQATPSTAVSGNVRLHVVSVGGPPADAPDGQPARGPRPGR